MECREVSCGLVRCAVVCGVKVRCVVWGVVYMVWSVRWGEVLFTVVVCWCFVWCCAMFFSVSLLINLTFLMTYRDGSRLQTPQTRPCASHCRRFSYQLVRIRKNKSYIFKCSEVYTFTTCTIDLFLFVSL